MDSKYRSLVDYVCKYCQEELKNETVLQPCLCKDYVHRKCLEKWLEIKKDATRCEICGGEYKKKIVGIEWKFVTETFLIPIMKFILLPLLNLFLVIGFYGYSEFNACDYVSEDNFAFRDENRCRVNLLFTILGCFIACIPICTLPIILCCFEKIHNIYKKYYITTPLFFLLAQAIGILIYYAAFRKWIFNATSASIGFIVLISLFFIIVPVRYLYRKYLRPKLINYPDSCLRYNYPEVRIE